MKNRILKYIDKDDDILNQLIKKGLIDDRALRNIEIRADYIKLTRLKIYKVGAIYRSLSDKYNISFHLVQQIILGYR